ncbi:putative membrane protein YccC [Paraburkholderia caballeronis]|uniref:FUSC family protein n=1 Tax=Paraburkholderia caballeronis TaxID=416943 RepID=UPI0010655283|nr:FUSC family protein [Paraburkholderia caballeronis]TDV38930.1 putative membrane protein YccC [Paraburkholderia caballeronis]
MSVPRRFRFDPNAFLSALARRRPAWMVSFSIEEASLSEGLRAACAATAMLLLGRLLGDMQFSWAAIGAFWTCLADAAGSRRRRFWSMGGFAVLSTLAGAATAFASGAGTLPAALAILVCAALAGLTSLWSAAVYQVAILVATACVVMVDQPHRSLHDALPFAGVYFSGCVFAIVLSFTVWRLHPLAPARYAMRLAYAQLAELARDVSRLVGARSGDAGAWAQHASDKRSQARAALEAARGALIAVPRAKSDGRRTYRELAAALADAESAFGWLIAASDVAQRAAGTMARHAFAARGLDAIARTLARHGDALAAGPVASGTPALRARLQRLAARVAGALGQPLPLRFFDTAPDAPPPGPADEPWLRGSLRSLRNGARKLRDGASLESAGVRHAGRVAVATTAAFLIVRLAGVPYGYWATMATLLVLQPSVGSTWPRSVERAAGSAAGAALAAAIGHAVHTPLALSLTVFPLVCLTMTLRRVSYGLFVLFLTPTFVLVADFATPSNELGHALARFGNNLLGVVLALLATHFLWPQRDAYRLRDSVVAAIRANLAYLDSALPQRAASWEQCETLRRAAGIASGDAERTLRFSRMESVVADAHYRRRVAILALLRGIAGTAGRLRADAPTAQGAPTANPACASRIAAAYADIERLLEGEPTEAPPRTPLPDLPLAQSDALAQLARLRELIAAGGHPRLHKRPRVNRRIAI